jgi:hypothetical protein
MQAKTLAVLVTLMLAGCDPGTTLKGRLTGPDGGPIVGATVRTICSSQSGAMSATSDEEGRFSTDGLGCVGDDCRLELVAPGKAPRVLPVGEHCRGTFRFGCGKRGCSHVDVHVVVE